MADKFHSEWLIKSYNEALQQCGDIQMDIVGNQLASELMCELDTPERQTVLFNLLGKKFVQINYPNHHFNPVMLEKIPERRRQLMEDDLKV
jgi:hypothetical protein